MKVRDANLAEIAPKGPKPRPMSPRQLAIRKRELVIGRALRELAAGDGSDIKKVELEDGEKLGTIRAAVARQITAEQSDVLLVIRSGSIYLRRRP